MKAVVDTNGAAYLPLGTEQYADEAGAFLASLGEAHAPAVWGAEIANVLWMATRHKIVVGAFRGVLQSGRSYGFA